MAKKWWKGLLRTMGGGRLAVLPMLPLGTYTVCFENPGVGTLLSGLYSYFTSHLKLVWQHMAKWNSA